jgi:predicted ribosomally synthesized peptide with SipW-like signal peptide
MVVVACLGLLYTSLAYFEDTEASIVNSFQAGTWSVDGGSNHTFRNLTAGQSGTETWTATNTGTVSAYVGLNISVIEEGTGDLGEFLMGYLYVSDGGTICGPDAPVNSLAGSYDLDLPLEPEESVDIILDWYVDAGYDPYDENDKVRFKISFNIQPAP